MNYDEARPLLDGTGFRWTTMRDGEARSAWPCRECVEPHTSAEEAERHFYDQCLATVEEIRFADWAGCRVCDTPTKAGMGNRCLGRFFSTEPLCKDHRTRAELAKLHPFRPGIRLIHS